MQVEWYEPTERDTLRSDAFASTTAGRKCWEREKDAAYRTLAWRMKHEGLVLNAEDMRQYEEWKATHPEPIP